MKRPENRTGIFATAIALCFCFALLLPTRGLAADVTVTAVLVHTEFTMDQATRLSIIVSNAGSATPELPVADGLLFSYQGQSSQSQWINGKSSASITFSFVVQAEKVGTHTIAPVSIQVEDKVYQTEPVTCTVLPIKKSAGQVTGKGAQSKTAPSTRMRSGEENKIGQMRIIPARDKMYTGQRVPFTIKAYFPRGLRASLKSMPGFTGENFMLQSLDDEPVQRERMVDGKPYIELVWNGALSAVKEGTFPLEVEMDVELLVPQKRQRRTNPFGSPFMNDPIFDNFFGQYSRRDVKLISPEKPITVMDLPAKGRPDDFKGAIGAFSLAVAASPLQGKVGDPITLKMLVTGSGNFDLVQAPEISDKNAWKTYPATDSFEEQARGRGKKSFEQAIVPTKAGLTAIPPVGFSYFDPDVGEYISLTSDPVALELEKVVERMTTMPDKPVSEEQQAGIVDNPRPDSNLAPLHTEPGRMVQAIVPLYQKMWFIVVMGLALLCLLAALLLYLRRRKLEADPTILLHKQVKQQLTRLYQQMETAIRDGDQTGFRNQCRTAIQLRLGEVWAHEPQAITQADLQQRLAGDAPLLDIFTRLEQSGYAGEDLEPSTLQEMLQTTRNELDNYNGK